MNYEREAGVEKVCIVHYFVDDYLTAKRFHSYGRMLTTIPINSILFVHYMIPVTLCE